MSEKITVLTDENFEQEVVQSDEMVVIDFWAPWCGPCKAIAPIMEAFSEEYAGKVKFAKLNVDENNDSAVKFGIRSIPTIMIFREGKVMDQIVGAVPRDSIKKLIDKHLSA
jgi:thioredoxin 1